MRIHCDLSAMYAWAPAPPGTIITKADVDALRAKTSVGEEWLIRVIEKVPLPKEGEPYHQHGMVIPELQIAERYAALLKYGKPETRTQVIEFEVRSSIRHHMHRSHIVKIHVDGDEPNEEIVRAALLRKVAKDPKDEIVLTSEEVEEAVTEYMDKTDLAVYLNLAFKTPASKEKK
jgi:hypothetical protein